MCYLLEKRLNKIISEKRVFVAYVKAICER